MKYNKMTFEEITENIGILCEKGMKTSQIMKLRRALRELSRDMYKNLKDYKKAMCCEEDEKEEPEEKPEEKPKKQKTKEEVVEEAVEEFNENPDF